MCTMILILLSAMIVTGCGEIFMYGGNQKPDDDISKAIYEAVGRKKYIIMPKNIVTQMKLYGMNTRYMTMKMKMC